MPSRLSNRQQECLRLTAFKTDKEIAFDLGLSEATVKKHVHAACHRLGVNRRKAALALLGRNVPWATNDPIGGSAQSAPTAAPHSETRHDATDNAAAALDMGRSGDRPGTVRPDPSARSIAHPSAGGPAVGRELHGPAGSAETRAQRGLGDRPARRFGYRPPPRGWPARLAIIALIVILGAVMMEAVFQMVVRYQHQIGEIDRMVSGYDGFDDTPRT